MGPCFVCGTSGAFGYRLPGLLSAQNRRGYLWACAQHRGEAEARRRDAAGIHRDTGGANTPDEPQRPAPGIAAQGDLFGAT